jgi:ABC-type Mn2+/Zn2+ transport system ATPase subunit
MPGAPEPALPGPVAGADRLTVAYAGTPALRDVSFELPRGAIVAMIGPNGAGKTTLMRALLGLEQAAAGSVWADGPVGYMPQLGPGAWDFPLNALEVALQGGMRRVGWLRRPGVEERRAALAALAAVGMREYAAVQIGQLSSGQRQRVLLARTLVQDAALLLLDEPLSGADAVTERAFEDTLVRLRGEGRTVVVATHDLGWSARSCDLVCVLAGRMVAFGRPAEALTGERLAEAYGGALVDIGGVRILAPEGHHSH